MGVQPVIAGALPGPLTAIVSDHATRQQGLLAAVMEGDSTSLFDLFHTDPLVHHLPRDTARAMFSEMVQATAHHLPAPLKGAA